MEWADDERVSATYIRSSSDGDRIRGIRVKDKSGYTGDGGERESAPIGECTRVPRFNFRGF